MKKNNKKGFFLSETMVVIAIVAVVVLSVFKLFNSVYYSFMQGENYNSVNAINALSNVQKYYESIDNIDTSLITEDISYVDLTNLEIYNSDYYERLKNEFKIDKVYLIDLNKVYTSNAINDFNILTKKYLNTLKNVQGIVLVVSIDGKEFAYTQIENYQTVTLIGDKDDEFAVYVPIGGTFTEPGYKNWEGEEPTITWENDKEVDTNKAGTYYKYYDFNGYLLRRKIQVGNHTLAKYVDNLESLEESEEVVYENGLYNPVATYEGKDYDTGIRYRGANPNNYVYFNCEDTDANSVAYGGTNYDYATACEKWRIIGAFDVDDGTITEKRVKLINTASTFAASWDSSVESVNYGWGINQWGSSTLTNGSEYAGADLMQLLNGYYIGKEGSTCIYCTEQGQEICNQTCTGESLKSANMNILTTKSQSMIGNAIWATYGVKWPENGDTTVNFASTAYLQEKGISAQNTGKECTGEDSYCNDSVVRTTNWRGLVGLMSVADMIYANGWLHSLELSFWTISPRVRSDDSRLVWVSYYGLSNNDCVRHQYIVFPSLYLNSTVEIVSGSGTETSPYIIK